MSDNNITNYQVGFLISGADEELYSKFTRSFSNYMRNNNIKDKAKLLSKFKTIDIERDFTVFAFYSSSIEWDDYIDEFFENLVFIVEKVGLSYLFYRLDPDSRYEDMVMNKDKEKVDMRLLDLMFIKRHIAFDDRLASELIA